MTLQTEQTKGMVTSAPNGRIAVVIEDKYTCSFRLKTVRNINRKCMTYDFYFLYPNAVRARWVFISAKSHLIDETHLQRIVIFLY